MIVVDIIQPSEEIAIRISKYLIEKKYAIQVHIDTNKISTSNTGIKTIRLFFITKALLFDMIDQDIKSEFHSDELLIYATPVSHISKEFGDDLRLKLKAV
jgi:restriction endonuclease